MPHIAQYRDRILVALIACTLFTIGCGSSDVVDLRYGYSAGVSGHSIQGTSVFSDMFRAARFRVSSARTLGRSIKNANVVVWFPDQFRPPDQATIDFFDAWLAAKPSRRLVYVARDYAAEIAYWQRLVDQSSNANVDLRRRLARAATRWATVYAALPRSAKCDWFSLQRQAVLTQTATLSGPWSDGLTHQHHPPVTSTTITPSSPMGSATEILLAADDKSMIASGSRPHWASSRLLLVTNGSMFLNLPIIDPANRQLAQRLIDACGTSGRAVFLQSGPMDPGVAATDRTHHLLRVFTTAPLRCILMHLSALGILYCFAVFPIFGRPQAAKTKDRSDFGHHVEALGRLLARTDDAEFARQARQIYLHQVEGLTTAVLLQEEGNPFRSDSPVSLVSESHTHE